MLSLPESSAQRPGLIVVAAAATLLLSSLSQTVVSTALPQILSDLGASAYMSWVVVAYLLTASIVAPIYGKMGDLFGRKQLLQVAMLIFIAGSALAASATAIKFLVIARAIQGLGGGGLMVVAMTVVADAIPARQRARVQGLLGVVFGLSTVAGPLLGGFLVDQYGWRSVFGLNIPLGLVALATISFSLKPDVRRATASVDYFGFALLGLTLGLFILTTSFGGRVAAWTSPQIIAMALATVLSLMVFVVIESRASEPILPLRLFKINTFVVVNAMGMLTGMAMFGCTTFVPLFLQAVKNESPTGSGLQLIPMMGGLVASSALAGYLMSWTGRYKAIAVVGAGLLSAGLFLLAAVDAHTPTWIVMSSLLLVGAGLGPINSVGVTAIQNAVDRSMVGVATASSIMFRQVGGSLGVSVLGAVFSATLSERIPTGAAELSANYSALSTLPAAVHDSALHALVSSMQSVFIVAAAASVPTVIFACVLRELPLRTHQPP